MDLNQLGRLLAIIGIGVTLIGALLMLIARFPALSSIGRLPGDIRLESQGLTCIFPIASMIVISIILTIIVNIIIRLINRP